MDVLQLRLSSHRYVNVYEHRMIIRCPVNGQSTPGIGNNLRDRNSRTATNILFVRNDASQWEDNGTS